MVGGPSSLTQQPELDNIYTQRGRGREGECSILDLGNKHSSYTLHTHTHKIYTFARGIWGEVKVRPVDFGERGGRLCVKPGVSLKRMRATRQWGPKKGRLTQLYRTFILYLLSQA